MIFKKVVTKKQKKSAYKKRIVFLLVFISLLLLNFILVYFNFIDRPKPIVSPLSADQISSTDVLAKELKEAKIEYESINTQQDLNYMIKLKNGAEVIIDPSKNIVQQLSSLQLILSQLKIEGKVLKRLDFRYQKPIITF